ANEQPVAARGSLKVYRQQWASSRPKRGGGPGPLRLKETLVSQEALETDATGRGRGHWTAARPGAYRIAFEARDAWKVKVSGSLTIWVAGPGMPTYDFLRQGVQLVVKKDIIPEGGRARVLLVVDQPGATVLLTQEANDEILRREVVRIPGSSRMVELPVSGRHAPNFYLQATMVRDGDVHEATQEIPV